LKRECPFGFGIRKRGYGGDPLARTNFQYTKRKKELERKKKMEEKLQRKLEKKGAVTETSPDELQPADDEASSKPLS
jgi:hypothetical protein